MESREAYREIFTNLGLTADPEAIDQLQKYVSLLRKWNMRMNLIASNEWSLIAPMLQEALWATRIYPESSRTHLDLGSGAGFPAVPISIARPQLQLDMVDSRIKRVVFLETVSNALKMPQIRAHHGRIGAFLERSSAVWDCISWKAIKISTRELEKLKEHAHAKTQFWMFHGEELPVEDPGAAEKMIKLVQSERFPLKSGWKLSIYLPE